MTRNPTLSQLEQELAEARAHLAEQRGQRQAAIGELKHARAIASDLSWELADLEQRLNDLKAQREGPSDPLVEREIASLSAARAALEERVLGQMLLVDELAGRTVSLEQALALAEQVLAEQQAKLSAERDHTAEQPEAPNHNLD
ncbi:MAG TPA: hypothetical protein VFU22_10180 [Roseiflexaceae bacterium]|nr:hypothetical protein [Roseiflexaceae bacterium]